MAIMFGYSNSKLLSRLKAFVILVADKYQSLFFLALIFATGLFFRLLRLGEQSLWIDEAYTINGALAVLDHGYPLLESGNIYANNFVTVYLAALLLKVAQFDAFDPWLLRLPAVLFGAALIIGVYVLGKKLFESERIAAFSAFLIAFSYLEIAWSRQVRGYAALAFFITLAAYYLWKYLVQGRKRSLVASFIAYALACLSHWSGLSFIPAFLAILIFRKFFAAKPLRFVCAFIALAVPSLFIGTPQESLIGRYLLFPFFPFLAIIFSATIIFFADLALKKMPMAVRTLAAFLAAVLVAYPLLIFFPKAHYKLPVSPQPDYRAAYSVIRESKEEGDVVISAHPILHRIYLGEKGMWLSTGIRREKKADFYTGLSPIDTSEELRSAITSRHGFVVVDGYSFHAANNVGSIDDPRIRLIYSDMGVGRKDRIWLYRF